jgi:hypothetical protein
MNLRKAARLIQFAVKTQITSAHKLGDKNNLTVVHSEVFHYLINGA